MFFGTMISPNQINVVPSIFHSTNSKSFTRQNFPLRKASIKLFHILIFDL